MPSSARISKSKPNTDSEVKAIVWILRRNVSGFDRMFVRDTTFQIQRVYLVISKNQVS